MSDYDDYDDYDSEYEEQKIYDRLSEEAEYTNKRLGVFPQDEWIKTHPLFKECIIHTFKNFDSSEKILFGLSKGAYSTVSSLMVILEKNLTYLVLILVILGSPL
jgi:hypothetical protein